MRKTPAKEITFDDNRFFYVRNKANILLYGGRSRRNDWNEVMLVIQYDPEKNTYYVLFMIKHVTKWSGWSDVDDEQFFDTIPLDGINRMAKPKSPDIDNKIKMLKYFQK